MADSQSRSCDGGSFGNSPEMRADGGLSGGGDGTWAIENPRLLTDTSISAKKRGGITAS